MVNIIWIAIILVIVCSISLYLFRAKKRGEHCIGCPYSKQCKENTCSGCGDK